MYNLFSQFENFNVFMFKVLHIVLLNQKKHRCALQEKIPKFEQDYQKKNLDRCSSTLEILLVKYVFIFVSIKLYYIW